MSYFQLFYHPKKDFVHGMIHYDNTCYETKVKKKYISKQKIFEKSQFEEKFGKTVHSEAWKCILPKDFRSFEQF